MKEIKTMVRGLAPFELQGYYRAVLKIGIDGLKGMEIIQAEQLKQFAIGLMENNNEQAYGFFIADPNANYPLGVDPIEHLKRRSSHYGEPETVIGIIDDYLNKNRSLSLTEQTHIISEVREFKDLFYGTDYSNEHKINVYKDQIRRVISTRPEGKAKDFIIEKLKDEIALLDGSFDLKHGLVNQPPDEKKKDKNIETRSFESYIVNGNRSILSKLKHEYQKPKQISLMVLAMQKNGWLLSGWSDNLTEFHQSLRIDFPRIGAYENLRAWVREKGDQIDIKREIHRISQDLKNL